MGHVLQLGFELAYVEWHVRFICMPTRVVLSSDRRTYVDGYRTDQRTERNIVGAIELISLQESLRLCRAV